VEEKVIVMKQVLITDVNVFRWSYLFARFEGITAALLKIQVFLDVTPCQASSSRRFGGL
jgi:hypothetical protein